MIQLKIIYNRKNKLDKDGNGLVQIRAYLSKRYKYFSTSVKIPPKFWNSKRDEVKLGYPNAVQINNYLSGLVSDLYSYALEINKNRGSVTLEDLESFFKNESTDFFKFYKEYVEGKTVKDSSKYEYMKMIPILKRFKEKISFEDLTYQFIVDLDKYFRDKGLKDNTVRNYHGYIMGAITHAVKNDVLPMDKNPYIKFKRKKATNERVFLTNEELTILETFKPPSRQFTLEAKLQQFLFCCYTGFRLSDSMKLKPDNFHTTSQGLELRIKSQKTGKYLNLQLWLLADGKAQDIVKPRLKNKFIFKQIERCNFNKGLAKIAKLSGLTKKLTSHVARRTFTNLVAKDLDLRTRQLILQHSDISTTQRYLNDSNEQIKTDLERAAKKKEARRILLEKLKDTDLPPDLLDVLLD